VASLLLDYRNLPYSEIMLNVAMYNIKAALLPVPTLLSFVGNEEKSTIGR
jgi:hypothetical protein